MRFGAFIFFAFLAAVLVSAGAYAGEPQSLPASPLVIETASGSHALEVEVALSPEEKRTGLMFRKSMPEDHGMLFFYQRPQLIGMWMKNTYIPLDMVFIYSDGRVASVFTGAVPMTLDGIESSDYVSAVLELNAGTVARLGIEEGDLVRHAIFGNFQGHQP